MGLKGNFERTRGTINICGKAEGVMAIPMPRAERSGVELGGFAAPLDSELPLVNFYRLCVKCLQLTTEDKHTLFLFNRHFLRWILTDVSASSLPKTE